MRTQDSLDVMTTVAEMKVSVAPREEGREELREEERGVVRGVVSVRGSHHVTETGLRGGRDVRGQGHVTGIVTVGGAVAAGTESVTKKVNLMLCKCCKNVYEI